MHGIILAPSEPEQWQEWRDNLADWRETTRALLDYDDSAYRNPEFAWVSSNRVSCFCLVFDQRFYDPTTGQYTLEAILAEGDNEFGGFDSILLWQAYPRLGLDERNQFDFFRDMPGGLPGLRQLSRLCHSRGIKVFIPYNPWDTGTRREEKPDWEVLVEIIREIDADGVFLDTLSQGSSELRSLLDQTCPAVVLNPEGLAPLELLSSHLMSWGQGLVDSQAPGVLRNKWFERRHMHSQTSRWDPDQVFELHTAWMNGSGVMVWENVFGTWVGSSPRYRSMLRSMAPIQRRFNHLFTGEGWTPLVGTGIPGTYASLWEGGGLRLWTLVNRRERMAAGTLLTVPHSSGDTYFDLISGQPAQVEIHNNVACIRAALRPGGIGCFLSGDPLVLGADFQAFLQRQAELDARADWGSKPQIPAEKKTPVETIRPRSKQDPPGRMGFVPGTTTDLVTYFRMRECGFINNGSLPWGNSGPDLNAIQTLKRIVELPSFFIDLTPVTNAEFFEFIQDSGYQPRHPENFLKHWQNNAPPPGKEAHPVVYVDLEDARAYARWAGKRLPTEEEWQYAAQGPLKTLFPWGSEMEEGRCNSGVGKQTTQVTQYPEGRSPFGCYDMCGNTWEWTESERNDGRSRYSILKGGSYYQAQGSHWYMDGGPQPANWGTKMLLMWAGLDRCATIGFRCVVDAADL